MEEPTQIKPKKLYFCAGVIPTKAERDAAQALGITAFRNARVAARSESVEPNLGCAGKIPAHFLKAGCEVLDKPKAPAAKDK